MEGLIEFCDNFTGQRQRFRIRRILDEFYRPVSPVGASRHIGSHFRFHDLRHTAVNRMIAASSHSP